MQKTKQAQPIDGRGASPPHNFKENLLYLPHAQVSQCCRRRTRLHHLIIAPPTPRIISRHPKIRLMRSTSSNFKYRGQFILLILMLRLQPSIAVPRGEVGFTCAEVTQVACEGFLVPTLRRKI